MAKSRVTTNPMYVGGAGGYTFYVRGGEQVIRQRKNNSNYGAGASRTMPQMIRRIRWGNLVNVFKSQKSWQPKAYDSKTKGQTDYNIFMALNINQATVGLTKEMCEAGCAVIEGYQVSRGSLPPIALTAAGSGNQYVTDIKISNAISGSTTVGQLAADILANNSQFVEGDNIAFIFFKNWKTTRTEWPYAATSYTEITLDTTSTTVINSIPQLDNRLSKSTGGYLQASWSVAGEFDTSREVGFVAIHTRKSASMLAVSSQEILMNSNSLVAQFSGAAWDNQCVLSYGLTDEVPLDPNFNHGVITHVTANGATVANADTLSGSQVVRVYGDSLYGQGYRFVHNGIDYTPLSSDDEYDEFILTDNGSYIIYVGSRVYMSFSVTGITIPQEMTGRVSAYFVDDNGHRIDDTLEATDSGCLNYAHKVTAATPSYRVYVIANEGEEISQDLIEAVGGSLSDVSWIAESRIFTFIITPTSADTVVYVSFDDYIFFVSNYSS